ncbi:MAG: tail fiber domain-containing protein [Saprospiraceae bacterium]|nr:tail fiber domain-containing protein [Saprospiraceae bacterium]MBK8852017.1 tail fiber domain-containing protein [Saprospiraceae bacterium]MBK9686675.1 tail fiber domain-containing protein [Saprospiraceae bacterium]
MKKIFSIIFFLFVIYNLPGQGLLPQVEVQGYFNVYRFPTDSSLFIGMGAGYLDDGTDNENQFMGIYAGYNNTIGTDNLFIGMQAGFQNQAGTDNVFVGRASGELNTLGSDNTFVGRSSGRANTLGINNTFLGRSAGIENIGGSDNTFVGRSAGGANTNGRDNTFVGRGAGLINTSADDNTFMGRLAGSRHRLGNNNTFIGESAGKFDSLGSQNTVLGANADVSAYNLVNAAAYGYLAKVNASNAVVIGNNLVTNIGGYANWSNLSDARFKKEVRYDVPGIDFVMGLKPATYVVDRASLFAHQHPDKKMPEIAAEARSTGFIAQEVEALCNSLQYEFSGVVKPENDSQHYQLRYAEFVVPMVKALQEQQAMIKELQAQVAALIGDRD